MADTPAPYEDREYDPTIEPKSSKAWWNLIVDAEKAFRDYQDKADNIDKQYANLSRLAAVGRDREFQMFWANVQVVGPSIYSRPPVPVVTPRFKERRPVPRTASEMLERATTVMFEQEDIDSTMRLVRDDLVVVGRGVVWVRYETKEKGKEASERVCIEHKDRRDFLHDPAREWREVDWVASRSWLTHDDMVKRFTRHSSYELSRVAYTVQKDDKEGAHSDPLQKCGVWEIWSKSQNKVVWITEGFDDLLDDDEPHLKLEGFFPCPRPAYSTVQRRSLVPVPDMVLYKDQLEEINELTGRISALTDALKVRGFYPAGAVEVGDAVEAAIKSLDNRQVLIPISNWQAFGQGGDPIVWLPLEMIANTVTGLVEIRKQLIDDVYQITGLSDIMRGATKPSETLGAQQLKSQYGSIRIRDRTDELVRFARDISRITAEIMAENFDKQTLLDMSQMELPTDAEIAKQVREVEGQIKDARSNPEIQKRIASDPKVKQQADQMMQQAQQHIADLKETVTSDQCVELLKKQKLRPFVLDIETDSTIAPDEDAQKQRATEYLQAMGGLLQQIVAVKEVPEIAPVLADAIKFANSQFRVGREVQATVDEFADRMKQKAAQPAPPNPEHAKAQADQQAAQQQAQVDQMKAQADVQKTQAELQIKAQEAQSKAQNDDLDRQVRAQEAQDASQARQADLQARMAAAQLAMQQTAAKADADARRADFDMQAATEKHAQDMELGVLNIELLRTKIDQATAQTENAERATEATIAAKRAAPAPGNGASA